MRLGGDMSPNMGTTIYIIACAANEWKLDNVYHTLQVYLQAPQAITLKKKKNPRVATQLLTVNLSAQQRGTAAFLFPSGTIQDLFSSPDYTETSDMVGHARGSRIGNRANLGMRGISLRNLVTSRSWWMGSKFLSNLTSCESAEEDYINDCELSAEVKW
ncbi:hypothetical protein E2C01_012896 [Portunus trituberculatus]|uniref:Uncharacterized protein n=1 Tax=Portunus trituberculatus TaxID=210409 RepID=A0A5B7DFU1_PORTR|nr:hypothetical protein [Portunus trituberculatus]